MIKNFKSTYRVIKGVFKFNTRGNMFLRHPVGQTSLIENLTLIMPENRAAGVFFLDVVRFHEVQQQYGSLMAGRVLSLIEQTLKEVVKRFLPESGNLVVENIWADDFLIIFPLTGDVSPDDLLDLSVTVRLALKDSLNAKFLQMLGSELELHIGYAVIEPGGELKPEIKLYNALREAQKVAKGVLDLHTIKLTKIFKEILSNQDLVAVYQPIVSLFTGEVLGWEALTRGPENSYFSKPDVIFNFAEETGLLYPTEKVCRRAALSNVGELGPEQKLFLNVHPRTMNNPGFVKGETLKRIGEYGLTPRNIVFEITERHSIKDYHLFRKTLEHYRSQGYQVAVDDVGAGFSGLQSIAELRPDFIKIDMSLVREIDKNPVREAVVESLLTLAGKINCQVIAEGIEYQSELNTLLSIGVHYGQGYYLARPAYPKTQIPKALVTYIRRQGGRELNGGWGRPISIGDIAEPAAVVNENIPVAEVKEKLDAINRPISGVVVMRGEYPVGLVMRHNLFRVLSFQYGVPLYWHRPISAIMDGAPLMLDAHTPLELAAETAMNRVQEKIYDDLVILNEKKLAGVVTVQRLLDSITRIQVELAKGANPLTGLPGNVAIEEELSRRARSGQSCNVIYADLDGFKGYNDTYGFESGDRMIMLLARIICHATKKYGAESDFVGHIGGDDFLVITLPEYANQICKSVVLLFERLVKGCFSSQDREKGKFFGQNREGHQMWLPLVSVSLAILECQDEKSFRTLAERTAQLKKYAKSLPGSVYVRDRRYLR